MNITINGRKVNHIHSIQKFYDYSTSPPTIKAVYIEGSYDLLESGKHDPSTTFYCKSDIDKAIVVIDGKVIDN